MVLSVEEMAHRWRGFGRLALEPKRRTGLRILQVAVGLMMALKCVTIWPYAAYLWGPHGIAGGGVVAVPPPLFGRHLGFLVERIFDTHAGVYIVLFALCLAASGLICGRFVTASLVIALVAASAIDCRLPLIPDGGDNIAAIVLVYMLFTLPPGKDWEKGSLRVWFHNLTVLAILIQTAIVYFVAGISKGEGVLWTHGVALYYISQVGVFSSGSMQAFFTHPLIVTAATYLTLFWEVMFPAAMLSPLRIPWIFFGLLFEAGIACQMGLVIFAVIMLGLLSVFVTDGEYSRGVAWVSRKLGPPALLYIDGYCPSCRKAGELIASLDWGKRVEVLSFRHDFSYGKWGISPEALERRMYFVDARRGRVLSGFEAVRGLAREIPAFWAAWPFLWIAGKMGVGDRVYDFLAARRRIIPDPAFCSSRRCEEGGPDYSRLEAVSNETSKKEPGPRGAGFPQ